MTNEEIVRHDAEYLTCQPWGDEEPDKLITSLKLNCAGEYGSKIIWMSDCTETITNFGRVIRPKWGFPPVNVTMTAVVSYADAEEIKKFHFTVLPDESFVDPEYETNEHLFERLNTSKTALCRICESAKRGHMQEAKDDLLQYLRQKDHAKPSYRKILSYMPSGLCRMMTNGVSTLQRCDRFYMGTAYAESCVYEEQKIPIQNTALKDGMTITFDVCALFNEVAGVKIAGSKYPEKVMRPRLLIVTKNGTSTFACEDSATLGAGKNIKTALAMQKESYVKLFGDYLGDETFHSLFRFCINGLDSEVVEAHLILYMKKDMELEGDKELLVILFPENIWEGGHAKWSDFKWQFANRNGLPESDTWDYEEGFDFEYLFQRVRFMHFPWLAEKYKQTGDEDILYAMLKTVTDFIKAQGMPRTYRTGQEHIGSAWRNDTISQTLCGGWPRGLDAAERIDSFSNVFGELVKSQFMTPDACTAILKYAWDSCHALAFQSLTEPVTNLRQFEIVDLLNAAIVFDDFTEQPAWLKTVHDTMEQMMFSVTLEDGTYKETTGSYNVSVCQNFVQFKKVCIENGVALSDAFDRRLKLFARYNVLLLGPAGESLQYGDSNAVKLVRRQYPELTHWFQDDELTFLLTRGTKGKEPAWTSFRFPVSGATMLRSSWQEDAVYIFTQARGGGSHGHQDDNHITLIAGGRVLLTDAGIFTYSNEDPYRKWGKSPLAHNTICINDMAQDYDTGVGSCYEWITDCVCDIISQGTNRYAGFSYTRRIVFMKPDRFIVTDEIIPENLEQENEYKQPWHMLPDAKMSFDERGNSMRSNFESGVNILIRTLDNSAQLKQEMGWYDYGYQQLSENPFGYFEKRGIKGRCVFQTLIQIIHP